MHNGWLEFLNDFETAHNITSRFHNRHDAQESSGAKHLLRLRRQLGAGVINIEPEELIYMRFFYSKIFENVSLIGDNASVNMKYELLGPR